MIVCSHGEFEVEESNLTDSRQGTLRTHRSNSFSFERKVSVRKHLVFVYSSSPCYLPPLLTYTEAGAHDEKEYQTLQGWFTIRNMLRHVASHDDKLCIVNMDHIVSLIITQIE